MTLFNRKRIVSFLLCLFLFGGLLDQPAKAAPPWPDGPSIQAEGGILMDANSGAILYGKNIHEKYFPASITKILTALIIIENCEMDEVVTFSHNAVYNVEVNSSNANLEEGDRLTVRDCLYAMMLKSANEAGNALAEHLASSTEAFSTIMNAKAAALGCTDSHFNNPSGLNDPEHYTSAHDMALIAQAAFQNEIFAQIVSTLYYDLPPTKRNPDGLRIYPGHQMIKKNSPNFYPGAIGGKTGYTSLAGNTLVTCAKRDDMQLITVVLNGHQTHYKDTKTMMNFGFRNFRSLDITEFDDTYTSIENDMTVAGLPITDLSVLEVQRNRRITLPLNAEFSDTVSSISYDLPPSAPSDAVARILYDYGERNVGSTYLIVNKEEPERIQPLSDNMSNWGMEETLAGEMNEEMGETLSDDFGVLALSEADLESDLLNRAVPEEKGDAIPRMKIHVPAAVWWILGVILVLAAGYGVLCVMRIRRRIEYEERRFRYKRRQQRLQDIGISGDEFQMLLYQRRQRTGFGGPKRRRTKRRR